ncbi:MAG: hypothetical protein GEEBNDBF_01502 [bacterium]|nr:hypothetical protein [bacterium]
MTPSPAPSLTIGTCAPLAGTLARGLLPVGHPPGRPQLYVPVQIARGLQAGPVLLLLSAVHGDEVTGIEVIRQIMRSLPLSQLHGAVVALPITNPPAFRAGQRLSPDDQRDLNRSFPGLRDGVLIDQLAWHLFEDVLRQVDVVIDLHDAGRFNQLYPHCRIPTGASPALLELARAFGTEALLERSGASGMLAIEADRILRLPVLTIELGGGGSLDPAIVAVGTSGVTNVLYHLGMLPGETSRPATQFLLREQSGLPAPLGGLLHLPHATGTPLRRGELVALITDPFSGREEAVLAPQDGVLFGRRCSGRVEEGESLGSLIGFQSDRRWGALPLAGQLFDNQHHAGPLTPAHVREAMAGRFSPEWHRQAAE